MPGTGAPIDVNIERLFRININKYMLTKNKHSLGYAYRKFYTMLSFIISCYARY